MSKNKKKNKNAQVNAQKVNVQAEEKQVLGQEAATEAAPELAETAAKIAEVENSANAEVKTKKDGKAVEVKAKDVDKKKKKEKNKKPNKVAKAIKDTGSELKKVTWPKFKEVVKQTGIVLVVVIVFALVLLGIDKLCSLLTGLLY